MKYSPCVIIADDDADIRSLIVTLVEKTLPDARIKAFENGRKGFDSYQKHGADLVISNFMMPEMDGPSLVALLRHSEPDLPIIMVSGSPEAKKEGFNAGVDTFIDKVELGKRLPEEINSLLSDKILPVRDDY